MELYSYYKNIDKFYELLTTSFNPETQQEEIVLKPLYKIEEGTPPYMTVTKTYFDSFDTTSGKDIPRFLKVLDMIGTYDLKTIINLIMAVSIYAESQLTTLLIHLQQEAIRRELQLRDIKTEISELIKNKT
jgi:hypothetical protein